MTQTSTVKDAAIRLQKALKSLESSLVPMLDQVDALKKQALDAESFKDDRVRMAAKLDEAAAREKEFKLREEEFSKLAAETNRELESVITQVVHAMGEGA